jgi:nicotinamidase-related amidase
VLSTTREAADKDYQLTILSDLCADPDAEVHAMLLEKVFPRQATVIASEQWINDGG